MKQKDRGFGVVGIIGLIAVVAVGAVIYTQTGTDSEVSRENATNSPTETVADAQNTINSAVEATNQVISNQGEDTMADKMEKEAEMEVKSEAAADTSGNITSSVSRETSEPATEEVTRVTGTFEDYSPEKLARAANGDVVLFFHASWCPSCRSLESDITANLSEIPDNTHILKVDYDSATALRQQYGVVRQHTLVQVDAKGNAVKTLTGLTNTLDQVVAQI